MLDAVFGSADVSHNKMELYHDYKDHIINCRLVTELTIKYFLIMHNIRFDRREKLCGPQKPTVQKSNDLNSIKHGKNVLYGKNEVAISTVLQSKVFPSD